MKKKPSKQTLVSCACGYCNEMVLTPNVHGNPVRFVLGHQHRGKAHGSRYGTGKYEHLRGVMIECECKCGGKIPAYDFESHRHRRFIKGHQWNGRVSPKRGRTTKNYDETKECECGCGRIIPRYNKKSGIENRFALGHQFGGKPLTPEHREKISEGVSRNMPSRGDKHKSVPTVYNDKKFDSWTEAWYAMWMDGQGYRYEYHPPKLRYLWEDGTRHNYHPDFWVEDLRSYVEVKGWLHVEERKKMELVRKSNPDLEIRIVTARDMEKLGMGYKEYSDLKPIRPLAFAPAARRRKSNSSTI